MWLALAVVAPIEVSRQLLRAPRETGAALGCLSPRTRFRTATRALNRGKRRHSAALSEFRAVFLNGMQRSVNRKVQASNPWSGAKSELDSLDPKDGWRLLDSNRIATGAKATRQTVLSSVLRFPVPQR